jgi:hypothetical protein
LSSTPDQPTLPSSFAKAAGVLAISPYSRTSARLPSSATATYPRGHIVVLPGLRRCGLRCIFWFELLVCFVNRPKQIIELRNSFDGPDPIESLSEQFQIMPGQQANSDNALSAHGLLHMLRRETNLWQHCARHYAAAPPELNCGAPTVRRVAMGESESSYHERRAIEEAKAALEAKTPKASARHAELAARHKQSARHSGKRRASSKADERSFG